VFNFFVFLIEFFLHFDAFLKVNNNFFGFFFVFLFGFGDFFFVMGDGFKESILNSRNLDFDFFVLLDQTLGQTIVVIIIFLMEVVDDIFGVI
jgi:hypothetical protein